MRGSAMTFCEALPAGVGSVTLFPKATRLSARGLAMGVVYGCAQKAVHWSTCYL